MPQHCRVKPGALSLSLPPSLSQHCVGFGLPSPSSLVRPLAAKFKASVVSCQLRTRRTLTEVEEPNGLYTKASGPLVAFLSGTRCVSTLHSNIFVSMACKIAEDNKHCKQAQTKRISTTYNKMTIEARQIVKKKDE